MKIAKFICFLAVMAACQPESKKEVFQLPFYNDETWSAEWIDEDDPKYDSIHQIGPFKFVNQDGDTLSNKDFDGKIYAANFFFTACPTVCPKMKKNLSLIQEAFAKDNRVKILSHSVMPWADSVSRLKDYAMQNEINSEVWSLVTGKQEDLYKMGRMDYFADEGFGKGVTSLDDFLHTENIILVDQERRIRGIYNGTIKLEMKRMISDMQMLLD